MGLTIFRRAASGDGDGGLLVGGGRLERDDAWRGIAREADFEGGPLALRALEGLREGVATLGVVRFDVFEQGEQALFDEL